MNLSSPITDACRCLWLSIVVGLISLQNATLAQVNSLPDQRSSSGTPQPVQPTESPANVSGLAKNQPIVLRAEAYAGQPYGVGKFTFRLQPGDELVDRTEAVLIKEAKNRILYPIVSKSAFQSFLQNITGSDSPPPTSAHTVWFLFRGEAPLEMSIEGTDSASFQVPVEFVRPRQFDRRVRQWWDAFNRVVNDHINSGDYPPLVQSYLKALVGKRFGLSPNATKTRNPDPLMQTFELMFDVESLRSETIARVMADGIRNLPVNRAMPAPIRWSPVIVEDLPAAINIEPIAKWVPQECFYLRFGTWKNQLWLQRLMEEFGGDLSRMIQVRGFQYRIQSKFLDQMAIQSSEFDKLFGGRLIDDVAVIGTDTYFDSGSAVGILLHARDTQTLKGNLSNKRQQFAKTHQADGVTIRNIVVGDDTIEFLSTPDNRYRSFYASSGNCHLVTTSLVLAKRFLEAGKGIDSLADSQEYQFARYNLPLEREDTVFVYLSTRFFQNLLSPQYQIELRRRNQIATEIMLFELARLAAFNEKQDANSIEALVSAGYLPEGFGYRPDGGQLEFKSDYWVDSIRGRRGFFAPIPDLPIQKINEDEEAWFIERAQFFTESIKSLDPMFIAIKRFELRENVERIVFDARLAPFGEDKYGWLINMLGPPLSREVQATPNDIATFQASMRGGGFKESTPPHQIFAGVQDRIDPAIDLRPTSFLRLMRMLRETPGYLGSWPNSGHVNWVPGLGGQPDAAGYTYSRLLKLWRLQWDSFSILSFDPQRLETLKPHLRIVDSERPAQVRLKIGDLSNSKLRDWANSVNFRRAWQTSIANIQLLNLLTQQFRVPPDQAKQVVERMMDVELVCSLGGDYVLGQIPSGRKIWQSSKWPSFTSPQLPAGHVAPFLSWFRGVELEVSKTPTQFSVHGFLDMKRQLDTAPSLPAFELFKGFSSVFGKVDPKKESKDGVAKENSSLPRNDDK